MDNFKTAIKLLLLIFFTVVFVILIKMIIPPPAGPSTQLFESIIATPTPKKLTSTPIYPPTTIHTITPAPTSTMPPAMATKAAIVAKSASFTPSPPRYYPVRSKEDVVNVVFKDENFVEITKQLLEKAVAGTPVQVRWLGEKYEGPYYYLIPFWESKRVIGIAQVWVNDGKARMGMWSDADLTEFPMVSQQMALKMVKEAGFQIIGEPELVFLPTLETGSNLTNPQWRIFTDQGYVYVFWMLDQPKLFLENELHPIREK